MTDRTVRVDTADGNKVTQFVEAKQEKPGAWKTNGFGAVLFTSLVDGSALHAASHFVTNGSYMWFEAPESQFELLKTEFDKGNLAAKLRS